jgi:hypothetical protein
VIAIKNTWQTWDAHPAHKDDMGRVLHIPSTYPSRHSASPGLRPGRKPPQNKRRDACTLALAHAEADQTEAAAKTAVHLLAGDWNAVLADRASG